VAAEHQLLALALLDPLDVALDALVPWGVKASSGLVVGLSASMSL